MSNYTINATGPQFSVETTQTTNTQILNSGVPGPRGPQGVPGPQGPATDTYPAIVSIAQFCVPDSTGDQASYNTAAMTAAIAATSGKARLHIPASFTLVLNSVTITQPCHIIHDGYWKLADGQNANILDLQADAIIEGTGTFDGNRTNQTGGVGTAVGGICSNCNRTGSVQPLPPDNPIQLANVVIRGVTIQECFNWPISMGYVDNLLVENVTMRNSNSSPQTFYNTTNAVFRNNIIHDIDDGGLVIGYKGAQHAIAENNYIYNTNQGIGCYAETSDEPADLHIQIVNNRLLNIRDGGIGVTTGGTNAENQRFVLIANNMLTNCNSGNNDGRGAVGLVGAFGVHVVNNMISYSGLNNAAGNKTYAIYANEDCDAITIEGNTFYNIGSTAQHGVCIYLDQSKGTSIFDNRVMDYGVATTEALLGGTIGVRGRIGGNALMGAIAGNLDEMFKQPDTIQDGQQDANGHQRFTGGLVIVDQANQNADNPVIASGAGTPTTITPAGSIYMRRDGSVEGALFVSGGGGYASVMVGASLTSDFTTTTASVGGSIDIATSAGVLRIPCQKVS